MSISVFLKVFAGILLVGAGIAQIGCATNDIAPSKALIIFTRASWGCLNGQELKEDVSSNITKDDGNYATVEEIKNPEDVFNRNELYLIFPAAPLNQMAGNFVAEFWCDSDQPETDASFSVEWASLRQKGNEWVLSTKIKGTGFIHVQMLYSRAPEMRQAWFSCPAAGVREPNQLTFFNAYPLDGEFGGVPQQKLSGQWQTLDLTVNPLFLEEAVSVDKCQMFLDSLDKEFAVSGGPLVWDGNRIQVETVRAIANHAAPGGENIFQLLLRADDGTTTQLGADDFVPQVRQKVALKSSDGKLVGAELWLRAGQ